MGPGRSERDLIVAEGGVPGGSIRDAEKRERLPEPRDGIGALGEDPELHHRRDRQLLEEVDLLRQLDLLDETGLVLLVPALEVVPEAIGDTGGALEAPRRVGGDGTLPFTI